MRTLILLALPLATLFLMAGCDQYEANRGYGSPVVTTTASTQTTPAQSQAAVPSQTAYQPARNSTTQPLPAGWGYIHEQDLTGGRVTSAAGQPVPAPAATARSGGS